MGIFFNNWLEEGFYEEDGYGGYTKLEKADDIVKAFKNKRLYENDGMGTTQVHKLDIDDLLKYEKKK